MGRGMYVGVSGSEGLFGSTVTMVFRRILLSKILYREAWVTVTMVMPVIIFTQVLVGLCLSSVANWCLCWPRSLSQHVEVVDLVP